MQAERYFAQLEEGIERLKQHLELGSRCDDVRAGYRELRIGRHVIYYTVADDHIRVVRVLHERMDVEEAHLEL